MRANLSSWGKQAILTLLLALVAPWLVASHVRAADPAYPSRPVRLIVNSAPGGALDALARSLAPKLTAAMGHAWVVDNRGGAAGNLGGELIARASPDGHTVLLTSSNLLTVNPSLYKQSFSVEKDLRPVTLLSQAEHVLVVHPGVTARTFHEFVALARQRPGALNFASAGVGTSTHLGAELLKKRLGVDLIHVPYKGGGAAAAAVLAGEAQVQVATVASTISFINAGRLRALATTSARRSRLLPDVPTIAESGFPGFEASSVNTLVTPAATPEHIVQRIRAEAGKAMQDPEVQAAMARLGLDPVSATPAELTARLRSEADAFGALIRQLGIRAE